MARSVVDVYNLALAHLGGGQLEILADEGEASYPAKLCRNLFPGVLDYCLSVHPWSFALRRRDLPFAERGPPWRPLPADCLRPVRIEDGTFEGAFFDREGDEIRTDQEPATLVYVARTAEPGRWPAPFAEALAWGLASVLASSMNNDAKRQQLAMESARLALASAIAADLGSRRPERPKGMWMRSRNG